MHIVNRLALAAVALLVSTAALADTSKLQATDKDAAKALKTYDSIVILDIGDGVAKKLDDAAENDAYHAEVVNAGKQFADALANKLRGSSKGFAAISREKVDGKALLVDGSITDLKTSNMVGRYIGLGAGAALVATLNVKDAESGKALGTIEIDLSSSPIPGAGNVIQTVDRFIDGAAARSRDELLIAKGALAREQTGRSGRAREAYGLDQDPPKKKK